MFSKLSRYRKVPDVTAPDPRGRTLASKDLRLLPDVTGTFRHTVDGGDRLDQLAYKYYSQALFWWNICDANPDFLSPLTLLGKDPVVTTSFPVVAAAPDAPAWAALFSAMNLTPGVEDVRIDEDVTVLPVSRAVVVTYNRLTVTPQALAAAIAAAGFQVGPFATLDQLGQEIVIPPKPVL